MSAPLTRAELLARPLLQKNLAALEAAGQNFILAWLREGPALKTVGEIEGQGDLKIIVAGGQSQASRRDPVREAEQWLERQRSEPGRLESADKILFGFGSPWLVRRLADGSRGRLRVFEPDPLVALAALSALDFSTALADPQGGLELLGPRHLSRGDDLSGAALLVHPPAQRREPAHLARLRRAVDRAAPDLSPLSGRNLKLMIIPPLSGGSWPVAVSLARAAERSGHDLLFLDWDEELKRLEAEAQTAPRPEAARLTARLFERTGALAAEATAGFQPDLTLALAQAPLDAPALARLRSAGAGLLAFWLVEDFRLFTYAAEVAPAYDFLFHIQEGLIENTLPDWGLDRQAYLPLAADPDLFQPRPPAEAEPYQAELSFMGAGYPNRRRLLTRLATAYWPKTGRPAGAFRVFGSGWNGADPRLAAHIFENGRRVSQPECALIFAGGRVNLNIHSSPLSSPELSPEPAFVNPRTFEIAAAAGFQIVDERPLLPPLFTAGRELVTIRHPQELPELINHYLAHPQEATAIGQAARTRVLAEHTYTHRLDQLLAHLGWQQIKAGHLEKV